MISIDYKTYVVEQALVDLSSLDLQVESQKDGCSTVFEYILGYLKDYHNIAKPDGYLIAKELCNLLKV